MAGYFLLIFSVGIGMGSLFTAKIQRGKINAHAVPVEIREVIAVVVTPEEVVGGGGCGGGGD